MPTLQVAIDARKATQGANEFTSASRKVGTEAQNAARHVDSHGKSINQLGGSLKNVVPTLASAAASFGLFLSAKDSIQTLIEFERGVIGVAKTTDFTGAELADFENRIIALSLAIPASTKELNAIAQSAGQLGVKGVDDVTKFTEVVAKMGRATDLSGDEAATVLARMLNVTGEAISSVDVLGSVLVELGNNSAATEREIALIATEVAKATTVFNISTTEASALGAAYASIGVDAAVAATSTGKAMRMIDSAVREGGDALAELARIAGVTDDVFKQTWQENAANGFSMFIKGLGDIINEGGNITAVMNQIGLSDERVLKTLQPLAKEYGILERSMRMARQEQEEVNALNAEVARASETLGARLSALSSTWDAVILQFRESNGAAAELVDVLSESIQILAGLHPNIEEASASAKILAEALRMMGIYLGALIAVRFGSVVMGWASSLRAATTASAFFNASLTSQKAIISGLITAWAGWKLGEKLTQEFEIVAQAGLNLGFGLQYVLLDLQATFEDTLGGWDESIESRLGRFFNWMKERHGIDFVHNLRIEDREGITEEIRAKQDAVFEEWKRLTKAGAANFHREYFNQDAAADGARKFQEHVNEIMKSGLSEDAAKRIAGGEAFWTVVFGEATKRVAELRKEVETLSLSELQREQLALSEELRSIVQDVNDSNEEFNALLEEGNALLEERRRILLDTQVGFATEAIKRETALRRRYFGEELRIQMEVESFRQQYIQQGLEPSEEVLAKFEATRRELAQVAEEAERMERIAQDVGGAFASAFEEAILSAKSFGETMSALVMDLQRIMIRNMITQPLADFVSQGLMGMFGMAAPTASAHGNVFFNGGLTAFAGGGVIDRPTYFPMANGGTGLAGEGGDEEGIFPLKRDRQGRLGVIGSGSGSTVHNHYWNITTPNADSFRRSSSQIKGEAERWFGN